MYKLRVSVVPYVIANRNGFARGSWRRKLAVRSFAAGSSSSGAQGGGIKAGPGSPTSAYVHLPFCKKKCYYCDFPVIALGSQYSQAADHFRDYVDLLMREISLSSGDHAGERKKKKLKTVFFGGGTPSLIHPSQLERIVALLDKVFGLDSDAEISMEADPGTFTRQKLQDFAAAGVNRLSVGVQAFNSELLEACGRSHSLPDVYQALDDIHAVSPRSWSIDLMMGLPHQTMETWDHSLDEAVKAKPKHISCYDLQIEQGTPFAKWYEPDTLPLPGEEATSELFKRASLRLRGSGFEHYEISSYATDGHKCEHNLNYWANGPFYGFGLGATSYVQGRRVQRPRAYSKYKAWVEDGPPSSSSSTTLPVSSEEELLETVMLRLRLAEGLALDGSLDAKSRSGASVEAKVMQAVQNHVRKGLVVVERSGNVERIRLSDPEGFLLSNSIISDIFAAVS